MCGTCFMSYCAQHSESSSHQCVSEPLEPLIEQILSPTLQDQAALIQLLRLLAKTILPRASGDDDKTRSLNTAGRALECLQRTYCGMRLMNRMGWQLQEEENRLVLDPRQNLPRSLRFQKGLVERIYASAVSNSSSAKAPKCAQQTFDYLLVLDFEATCQEFGRIKPQEIIELPVVLVNVRQMRVVGEFHRYIKPHFNPQLTPFCTELTGISQELVADEGISFEEAFAALHKWMQAHQLLDENGANIPNMWTWVTCGDWDLKTALAIHWSAEYKAAKPRRRLPLYFNEWINIKIAFSKLYPGLKSGGMDKMLSSLHMELIGRHHSGIADSRNIARIALRMLSDGWSASVTSWRVK